MINPYREVVAGAAQPQDAPILTAAWRATVDILTTTREPLQRVHIARDVAELTGCSPRTVENLLTAAEKAGRVTVTRRRNDGRSHRVYIHPLDRP